MPKRKFLEMKYINNYPVAVKLLNKDHTGVVVWEYKAGEKHKQWEYIFSEMRWRELGSAHFISNSSVQHHKLSRHPRAIHRWFFYPKAVELEKAQQKEKEQREKDLAKAKRSTRGGLFIPIT